MSYGLKGKVGEMVAAMQAIRKGDKNTAGREVSLRNHIPQNYKDASGKGLTIDHLFTELDIDEHRTSLGELLDKPDGGLVAGEIMRETVRRSMGIAQREQLAEMRANATAASLAPITGEQAGGQRFVSPEVFLDPINRGAVQGTFYPDLIISEIAVAQPQVIAPRFDLSDAALADSNEAATAEEGSLTYGTKTVTIAKKMKSIKITDEAIRFSPLSMIAIFLADFGRLFGNTLNNMAVDTIVNGEQADLSENATVIGVENTTNGITWFDLMRVAIQMGLIGQSGVQIIANATTGLNFLNLPEVKNRYLGSPLLSTQIRTPLQMPEDLYVSAKVGANKIVIQDPSSSIVQLTAQPMMVETERLVMKQINGTVMSTYTGFSKVQRKASVVIDGSIAYSGNGFPSYMVPAA